ncbi:Gpr1 family protein [Cyathus striatus]|nr:Gpr1 family protein [Cyathus striatus]
MSHHNHDIEKAEVQATSPHDALGRLHHHPPPPTTIANPGTLGLFSFASTTLILSLINAQARGVSHPNVVLGMAIFGGGLAQLLAGMWEFPRGNVFGGTAFTSYGAFWMSYAMILIPGTGVTTAYATEAELSGALGIYLITWAIVTFFLLIAALRKNVSFIALFFCLTITFILLGAGEFSGSVATSKAGGVVGVITAFIAYYIGLSELLSAEDMAVFRLPLGIFPKRID